MRSQEKTMSILYVYQNKYKTDTRTERFFDVFRSIQFDYELLDKEHIEILFRRNFFSRTFSRLLSFPVPFNFFWLHTINAKLKTKKYKLVVVRDLPVAWAAIKAAKKHAIPVLFDMAEYYPAMMNTLPKYRRNKIFRLLYSTGLLHFYEKWAVKNATATSVVCEENKTRLMHGTPNTMNIYVILNIPNIRQGNLPKRAVKDIPYSRTQVTAGYFGHIDSDEIRGFSDMINGIKKISDFDNLPTLKIEFIGDGLYLSDLKKSAREISNTKIQFSFLGSMNHDKAMEYIKQNWDIGIIPHRKTEFTDNTFPNKYYEYLYCGLLVLCANTTPLFNQLEENPSFGTCFSSGSDESFASGLYSLIQRILTQPGKEQEREKLAFEKYDFEKDFALELKNILLSIV